MVPEGVGIWRFFLIIAVCTGVLKFFFRLGALNVL